LRKDDKARPFVASTCLAHNIISKSFNAESIDGAIILSHSAAFDQNATIHLKKPLSQHGVKAFSAGGTLSFSRLVVGIP
jgi:hypothetical protein